MKLLGRIILGIIVVGATVWGVGALYFRRSYRKLGEPMAR